MEIMWRIGLFIFLELFYASMPLGAGEVPCPPWNNSSPEKITPAELPAKLAAILRYHKGNGFFTKFEGEKRVPILQRPLRSSGELIFLPHQGLYRKLINPFQQETLITLTAIRQRDERGNVETLDLSKLQPAKVLIDGFLAIFSGSWESIDERFQVSLSLENHQWTLGLQPKDSIMAQIITCIILEGERNQVLRLWVRESGGDVTRDQFFEQQILTPGQWQDYQGYFEWGR